MACNSVEVATIEHTCTLRYTFDDSDTMTGLVAIECVCECVRVIEFTVRSIDTSIRNQIPHTNACSICLNERREMWDDNNVFFSSIPRMYFEYHKFMCMYIKAPIELLNAAHNTMCERIQYVHCTDVYVGVERERQKMWMVRVWRLVRLLFLCSSFSFLDFSLTWYASVPSSRLQPLTTPCSWHKPLKQIWLWILNYISSCVHHSAAKGIGESDDSFFYLFFFFSIKGKRN